MNGIALSSVRLRAFLQRFPRFAYGHRKLAEIALDSDDVATAYASAHAYTALRGENDISHYLFGRCFLKRGSYDKATWHLEIAHSKRPNSIEIIEELVAAYLFQKRFSEAEKLFENIDPDKLSYDGLKIREYLKNREGEDGSIKNFNR